MLGLVSTAISSYVFIVIYRQQLRHTNANFCRRISQPKTHSHKRDCLLFVTDSVRCRFIVTVSLPCGNQLNVVAASAVHPEMTPKKGILAGARREFVYSCHEIAFRRCFCVFFCFPSDMGTTLVFILWHPIHFVVSNPFTCTDENLYYILV